MVTDKKKITYNPMGKCLKKRYLKQLRQRLYTQSHKVRQMLFAPGVNTICEHRSQNRKSLGCICSNSQK